MDKNWDHKAHKELNRMGDAYLVQAESDLDIDGKVREIGKQIQDLELIIEQLNNMRQTIENQVKSGLLSEEMALSIAMNLLFNQFKTIRPNVKRGEKLWMSHNKILSSLIADFRKSHQVRPRATIREYLKQLEERIGTRNTELKVAQEELSSYGNTKDQLSGLLGEE